MPSQENERGDGNSNTGSPSHHFSPPSTPSGCNSPTTFPRSHSVIFTVHQKLGPQLPVLIAKQQNSMLTRLVSFLRLVFALVYHYILLGPTLWVSAWLWLSWKCMQLLLTLVKYLLTALHTPASERHRKKRTVLISGGSTVQALHLARNFYSAGARVIVCEIRGLFGLARFSTAVDNFYSVPRPDSERPQAYVQALCEIVQCENISYFVPVSATSTAYYDALAKPHLELMGCTCFCPGVKEVWILDDILEVLQRCQAAGISTPLFYPIASREDLMKLYSGGFLRTGKHRMVSVGLWGCRNKLKVELPNRPLQFRTQQEISKRRPWVVIQEMPGEHFVTCTTIKESRVVANVTCRMDNDSGGLVPVQHQDVESWLKNFFGKMKVLRLVSGHASFRLVVSESGGNVIPLRCRVGVSMPYILYTRVHPRIVWKPCRHFSRQSSGPLVAENGLYWMPKAVLDTLRYPSMEAVGRLIGTVLDKREALFVFWDPLPYCAYYHLQLPLRNVLAILQHYRPNGQNGSQYRTLAPPVY